MLVSWGSVTECCAHRSPHASRHAPSSAQLETAREGLVCGSETANVTFELAGNVFFSWLVSWLLGRGFVSLRNTGLR